MHSPQQRSRVAPLLLRLEALICTAPAAATAPPKADTDEPSASVVLQVAVAVFPLRVEFVIVTGPAALIAPPRAFALATTNWPPVMVTLFSVSVPVPWFSTRSLGHALADRRGRPRRCRDDQRRVPVGELAAARAGQRVSPTRGQIDLVATHAGSSHDRGPQRPARPIHRGIRGRREGRRPRRRARGYNTPRGDQRGHSTDAQDPPYPHRQKDLRRPERTAHVTNLRGVGRGGASSRQRQLSSLPRPSSHRVRPDPPPVAPTTPRDHSSHPRHRISIRHSFSVPGGH